MRKYEQGGGKMAAEHFVRTFFQPWTFNTYWLRPRETVCFVDPRLSMAEGNIDGRGKHRQSRVHKTYCFPEVSVNKYFIIYQESKKRKNKANFIRKYMKYFINFLKNVKFNAVHNVIHKTFAVFGSPKVACPVIARA